MKEDFIPVLFLYSGFCRCAFHTLLLHIYEYPVLQITPLCCICLSVCFSDQPASECLVEPTVHIRGAALLVTSIDY